MTGEEYTGAVLGLVVCGLVLFAPSRRLLVGGAIVAVLVWAVVL